ncbi:MAG: STAS domain-containing protein [Actinomycetota bacterium]
MELTEIERNDGISQVALAGKLDIAGLHEVDVLFHGLTAAKQQPAIVDLSGVDYIASLGMGMLISCAQSLQRRGAKMALYGAHGVVDEALRSAAIDQVIPMVDTADAALAVVRAD